MHVNGSMILVQDGAPCHQLMVATEFLKINEISEQEMPGTAQISVQSRTYGLL